MYGLGFRRERTIHDASGSIAAKEIRAEIPAIKKNGQLTPPASSSPGPDYFLFGFNESVTAVLGERDLAIEEMDIQFRPDQFDDVVSLAAAGAGGA